MRRREFITLIGSAAACPLAARSSQLDRIRRVAVLMGYAENDAEGQARLNAFRQELAGLGWIEGQTLKTDIRWSAGDVERAAILAGELVGLQPDAILANSTPMTAALQRHTQTIPIVFVPASDPIGSGFVASLSHPGGNITGFINLESSLIQKWLELLKEIAPGVTRAAVIFNPETAPYADYYLHSLPVAAEKLRVETFAATARSDSDIAEVITGLAQSGGGGLVVMTDSGMFVHRQAIIAQTALHKVPAVYWVRNIPEEGGLLAYGADYGDLFRRAASYIDHLAWSEAG